MASHRSLWRNVRILMIKQLLVLSLLFCLVLRSFVHLLLGVGRVGCMLGIRVSILEGGHRCVWLLGEQIESGVWFEALFRFCSLVHDGKPDVGL